jgi:hypothetical protein
MPEALGGGREAGAARPAQQPTKSEGLGHFCSTGRPTAESASEKWLLVG